MKPTPQQIQKALLWLRQTGPAVAVELLVNFILPYVIYTLGKPSLGEVYALMASSGPPVVWSLVEFALKRRVDALSVLVLVGIALSLLAFIGGGGARFLQLRERLATAALGLIFLGSAAIRKPLIYQLARAQLSRKSSSDAEDLDRMREDPQFRRMMTVMTVVWGLGLVLESAVCCILVFVLTIPHYMIVSPIIGYLAAGVLTLWTYRYGKRFSQNSP